MTVALTRFARRIAETPIRILFHPSPAWLIRSASSLVTFVPVCLDLCTGRRAVVWVCRWVWVVRCEVRPCDPCARVRPCVPCVPCVSRLPPVSFYRYRGAVDSSGHLRLFLRLLKVGRGFHAGMCRWVWVDGCEVRPCDPFAPSLPAWRVPACARRASRVSRMSRVCPGCQVYT